MLPDSVGRTAGKTIVLRRLAQPWTLVVVVTGLFQLFRGAPIDGAFFLGVAALLLADAVGLVRLSGPARPRSAWLLAAAIPLAVALVLAPRHGIAEGAIVTAIGLTVLIFSWGDAVGESGQQVMSPAVRRAAILWSVVGVVCCLWEVASFMLGLPSPEAALAHPSISELFDPMLDSFLGRAIFTVLWLLLGIALLRRRGDARGGAAGDTPTNRRRRRPLRERAGR